MHQIDSLLSRNSWEGILIKSDQRFKSTSHTSHDLMPFFNMCAFIDIYFGMKGVQSTNGIKKINAIELDAVLKISFFMITKGFFKAFEHFA